MRTVVPRLWWLVLMRGLLAVGTGLALLVRPVTAVHVVEGAATYWVVDGGLAVWGAVVARRYGLGGWALLARGIVGSAIGLLILGSPLPAGVVSHGWRPGAALSFLVVVIVLLLLTVVQTVFAAAMELAIWARVRRELPGDWSALVSGLLLTLIGVAIFLAAMGMDVQYALATVAMLAGALLVRSGLRLRAWWEARARAGR